MGKTKRRLRRTPGYPWHNRRGPEEADRRRRAVGGGGSSSAGLLQWELVDEKWSQRCTRVRRSCWWGWHGRSCSGMVGRWRLELAGVRGGAVACSGAWKRGATERANRIECWGSPDAGARASWGPGVLQRANLGGGEVAAAERRRGGVAKRGGHQREERRAVKGCGATRGS